MNWKHLLQEINQAKQTLSLAEMNHIAIIPMPNSTKTKFTKPQL